LNKRLGFSQSGILWTDHSLHFGELPGLLGLALDGGKKKELILKIFQFIFFFLFF